MAKLLLTFCNPLLDISASVDTEFLEKYQLKPNDAILADPSKHASLFADLIANYPVTYSAGGAGQNATRGAQWFLPPGSTVYIGSVGNDEFGRKLRAAATGDGLCVDYLKITDSNVETGSCACLITQNGHARSLVANLGAANLYRLEHLLQPEVRSHLEQVKLVYITGFFLTVSPETIMYVAKYAHEHKKIFAMNLSAPFLCQFFKDPMLEALPYVDYLFGNEAEALAFAQNNNINTTNIGEIAQHLARWPRASPDHLVSRTVIFTQGSAPVIVATADKITEYRIDAIADSEIVDTNGAGDAFVGGFLSQLVQDQPMEKCIQHGHDLAGIIIRTSGIIFPAKQSF